MSRRTSQHPSKRVSDQSSFLSDLPRELAQLTEWFQAGGMEEHCTAEMDEFACSFLGALKESQALIPEIEAPLPKLLAWVLTHHLRNPDYGAAWLNLGFALRLIANSDHEPLATTRRQKALECFELCFAAPESARPIEIRAWAGKALTLAQLRQLNQSVRCARKALDLDRSDPNLWLLYSSILGMAGRKDEALALVDEAYRAYVIAGRPEELRHIFDSAVLPTNTPDPSAHLHRIQ